MIINIIYNHISYAHMNETIIAKIKGHIPVIFTPGLYLLRIMIFSQYKSHHSTFRA